MIREKLTSIINWELHQKLQKPRKISTRYKYPKKPKKPKLGLIWISILLGITFAIYQLFK
jgi:hypothetical protein